MSEITILHLSDIHFKRKEKEDNKTFRQTVQQRLIDAVKNHRRRERQPGCGGRDRRYCLFRERNTNTKKQRNFLRN